MEPEESGSLTSDSTTKLESSKPYDTGIKDRNIDQWNRIENPELATRPLEFLLWLQWLMNLTRNMRLQVRSMDLLSGLRIWRCCELWCRSQTWLGSHIAVALV